MTKGTDAKSYITKIFFPIYDQTFPWVFPKYDENFYLRGKFPSNFPHIWQNLRTRGKVPLDFPKYDVNCNLSDDNSTVIPPYMTRTFRWWDSSSFFPNYYKVIITLRKALPESNSITTDVIIFSVHWYGKNECIKTEIYINETTLT